MPIVSLFLSALVLLLAGGVLPLTAAGSHRAAHRLGAAGSITGGGCGLVAALHTLMSGLPFDAVFLWHNSGMALSIHIDPLAAFFLVPIFLLVPAGGIYALHYLDTGGGNHAVIRHWMAYNILALSMALVVTAADSFTFLFAWEMMSLSSFFLVVHDFHDEQTRKAGWLYLTATHLGAVFLFSFFFEAFRLSGSLAFTSFAIFNDLPASTALLFFAAVFIGFGAKAGLAPMYSWLPEAHSAAPSHVSALMSGVMIKTAVYAFLRMLTFLPTLPGWAGLPVMALGIGGAVFGIAMAAIQTDIKRSLAYSTVENIGIIFLGTGLWLFCRNAGFPVASRLALAGALLHIWNHALFKSLLFMGAGAVAHATGTREMSALGGLMRRMPVTSAFLVLGGVAVAAMPPLNGLISEFLIYLALFSAGQAAAGGMAFVFLLCIVLLATVGGLTLLVMARMIGIVCSGEPRTSQGAKAHEAGPAMLAAMLLPAALCLMIGIFPQLVLPWLSGPLTVLSANGTGDLPPLPFGPAWSTAALFLVILFTGIVTVRCRRHLPGNAVSTWGCGFVQPPTPSMSYTTGGFTQLAQDEIYSAWLRPVLPAQEKYALFPTQRRFRPQIIDPALHRILAPLFTRIAGLANSCRRLQAGSMNMYLAYIFLATLLLLSWNYLLL